jgi:hypothetical protein
MASKGGSRFGIHLQLDKIVMFEGATYTPGFPTNEEHVFNPVTALPPLYTVISGGTDIIFDLFTGGTSNNATTTLWIVNRPQASSTIVVNSLGVIRLK